MLQNAGPYPDTLGAMQPGCNVQQCSRLSLLDLLATQSLLAHVLLWGGLYYSPYSLSLGSWTAQSVFYLFTVARRPSIGVPESIFRPNSQQVRSRVLKCRCTL